MSRNTMLKTGYMTLFKIFSVYVYFSQLMYYSSSKNSTYLLYENNLSLELYFIFHNSKKQNDGP